MKKLTVALAACLLSIAACSPLRIIMNRTDKGGERIILTSNQRLFSYNDGTIDAALGTRINAKKDTVLAILLTCDENASHGIFDKDDRILIRLANDKLISLTNIYDKEYETKTEENYTQERVSSTGYEYVYSPWTGGFYVMPYEASTFIPRRYTTKTTYSYGLYLISKPDLEDIISNDVAKLRVEIENREIDMPNPKAAREVFASLRQCLNNGIHNRDKGTNEF